MKRASTRAKRKFKGLKNSELLYAAAMKLLPAGTGSNARLWRKACPFFAPCTIFIDKAKGSRIWDVDGNEYVDYRLGYGPVILGHADERVIEVVHRADSEGSVYALGNALEIEAAKQLVKAVPSLEMVRFANSGTEATMSAIRIARGFTKKDKIVKFEGHYHGSHNDVLWSTSPPRTSPLEPIQSSDGVPFALKQFVFVEQWNDFQGIENRLRKNHEEIACIICEPVMGNAAVIPPARGFLSHLRQLCDEYGVLLIFDEVKTGFRLGMGGAQQLFKVKPDLSCFAKSMSNGYPISAVGGKSEVMEVVAPGKVFHGGTYSSNPVSLAATLATLEALRKRGVFSKINRFGKKLMKGIGDVLNDFNAAHTIQGFPSMFQVLFTEKQAIKNYRELAFVDQEFFARLHFERLKRGVMVDEDNEEPIFTCWAHSEEDLELTLEALKEAVPEAKIPSEGK